MILKNFNKESAVIRDDKIPLVEGIYNAKYVIDTEFKGIPVAIFYGDKVHPDSGSRYFGLYWNLVGSDQQLMITNGAFIEDQKITCVVADDGEIIHSRYRHDYRKSKDGSVFIDGGQSYVRTGLYPPEKFIYIKIQDGEIVIDSDENLN